MEFRCEDPIHRDVHTPVHEIPCNARGSQVWTHVMCEVGEGASCSDLGVPPIFVLVGSLC